MVKAFNGHDSPVTCGSHSHIFGKDGGILKASDTLPMDAMGEASSAVGTGFRLLGIHPQKLLKQVGISVSPGTSNQFGVSVRIMEISDKALGIKDPYSRRCYLNSELKMRFLPSTAQYHYSIYNCLFEAAMEAAQTKCHCLPASFSDSADQCEANHLKCFNDIMDRIGEAGGEDWPGQLTVL